jgi:glucose/arabinose dehydrogenase
MNTKIASKIILLIAVAGLFGACVYFWPNIKGLLPAWSRPSGDIVEIIENQNNPGPAENTTNFPLRLPDGFKIEVFAKNLPGARVMAFDAEGDMWVTQSKAGKITKLDVENGAVVRQEGTYSGLNSPHGIAFDNDGAMYVAEENRVSVVIPNANPAFRKIADLPSGSGHFTRTAEFGPDGRLYVSIGSSCNVCEESDPRRASIYSMNKDGSDLRQFARGLRNTVFFDWSYVDGRMWGTDMGRDLLGDDVPPEEINIIKEGGNYGWPICYGRNMHDTDFDKKTYVRNPCMEPFETGAHVEMQAHSAPLGLAFVPEEGWPEEYWYDLIVAFHGSWNRTQPTGYKLARIKLDAEGNYQGTEDFITGWLDGKTALGRPVDVMIQPGGVMYVSDDKAGVVYKISRTSIE